MPLFLPKTEIEWIEPAAYQKRVYSEFWFIKAWWGRPLLVTGFVVFFSLLRLVPQDTLNANPPEGLVAAGLTIVLAVFLVYVVPWIDNNVTRKVSVFEKFLRRTNTEGALRIRFKDVASFTFSEEHGIPVIQFTKWKGKPVSVGISPEVDTDALRRFLEQRGITHSPV